MTNADSSNIYVQGNTPNSWLPSQSWQKKFLTEIHLKSTPVPSPFFITNGKYEYMAFPLKKADSVPCSDLKDSAAKMAFDKISFYSDKSILGSWFDWWRQTDNYMGSPPAGVLCNLTTGVCRFYVFTTNTLNVIQRSHQHDGPKKICEKCIKGYAEQRNLGSPVPLYKDYH